MVLRRWGVFVPRVSLFVAAAGIGLVTMGLVTGCGSGSASDEEAHPVLATTSIWADITREVGCGATIPALIPTGADPHTFEPSLRDRERVQSANTIISNGLGLEESLTELLDAANLHATLNPAHDRGALVAGEIAAGPGVVRGATAGCFGSCPNAYSARLVQPSPSKSPTAAAAGPLCSSGEK